MAASQQKRGEKNRTLDPLLSRALDRLRQHIAEKGISQSTLEKRTGFAQGHISKVLNGHNPEAAFTVVARLAVGAGVSIDWLIADAPAPAQPVTVSALTAAAPVVAAPTAAASSAPPPPKRPAKTA